MAEACIIDKQHKKKVKPIFNIPHNTIGASTSLRELSFNYKNIGELCKLINNVFKFQICFSLSSEYATFSATEFLWCICEMSTIGIMGFVCQALLSSRGSTKELVNELVMDYELPRSVRAQAKAFMQLIDAWSLRIYVYDFVDITLILKFITLTTTYLIVILQISHFM
ncbi:uncharacterized protein LOC134794559 [Cydia splendana]|uniref:uncharacterized protein LOC134794559 n=1 Tax=Cydia splendana TaxID=1100963 RepID=UPI00300CB78E